MHLVDKRPCRPWVPCPIFRLARRGHGEDRITDEGACSSGRGNGLAEVPPGASMPGAAWPPRRCRLSDMQTQPLPGTVTAAPDLASMDAPVRRLFERIAPALNGSTPDVALVATALIEFAGDHDYLMPRIRALGERKGGAGIHAPERGTRLMLVHRAEGQMSAIHDHGCWVALAPVTGVETHRHFRTRVSGTELARLELATERAVQSGEAVTMLTPEDTHAHGHIAGSGEPAYVLIMLGDDQRFYRRSEWDTVTGQRRTLEVGDAGRWLDSEPFRQG